MDEFIKSIKEDIYVGKEFEKFRKSFFKADENNDGLISVDQFRLLSGSVTKWNSLITSRTATIELEMPLKVAKKKEMFKKADTDNDGKIDYEEFIKSIEDDIYVGEEFEEFRKAFCKADENNDGLITENQFRLLFSSI